MRIATVYGKPTPASDTAEDPDDEAPEEGEDDEECDRNEQHTPKWQFPCRAFFHGRFRFLEDCLDQNRAAPREVELHLGRTREVLPVEIVEPVAGRRRKALDQFIGAPMT